MAKYHKYVFDEQNRKLIGAFDEMYKAEDKEGFDSWQSQNVRHLRHRLALDVLDDYNFGSVLEIGCGKGAMSQFLKRANNEVVGIDISPAAVEKARQSHEGISFHALDALEITSLGRRFDLATAMMTLAYIPGWRELIDKVAAIADYFFVVEYIPQNPIGMVPAFADLKSAVEQHFEIKTEVVLNGDIFMLLGHRRGSAQDA